MAKNFSIIAQDIYKNASDFLFTKESARIFRIYTLLFFKRIHKLFMYFLEKCTSQIRYAKTDLCVYIASNYPFGVINDKRQSETDIDDEVHLDNRVRIQVFRLSPSFYTCITERKALS